MWNSKFVDLLDVPKHLAFAGTPFESFIRHNAQNGEYGDGDIAELIADRVSAARRFEKHRLERTRPDGTIIEVSGSPLPSGGFITIYTDITEQKKKEAALENRAARRTEALRLSEARLQLIANEVPAGIVHLDADMRIARAYGMTAETIVGTWFHELAHPQTIASSAQYFEAARNGRVVDFDNTNILPNGRTQDVRTFLRPDKAPSGSQSGFYLVSVDMTQQKAAADALRSAQKMDALGRLVSGISHDFNNLLTVVLGNLIPMQDQVTDPSLRDDFLQPAIAAAQRGANLTNRLLNLARKQPINPEVVVADETIQNLMTVLTHSIPESIVLDANLAVPDHRILIDVTGLETAMLNLIVNASDAIEGPGKVSITTRLQTLRDFEAEPHKIAAGDYVRIDVSDTGEGIQPDEAERIFEPFHSTKAANGRTGLGLAIVYSFVQQSNGAIWVESAAGTGTVFSLVLPVSTQTPKAADAAPAVQAGEVSAEKPLVLLVEDDSDVRRVILRQLVDLGYAAIFAEDGPSALDVVKVMPNLQCVLTDVIMPGAFDGIGLAKEIAVHAPDVRVVLMSANMSGPASLQSLPDGIGFIRKPFTDDGLKTVLDTSRGLSS